VILQAIETTQEALEGIGVLVTPAAGNPPAPGEDFSWTTAVPDLGMPAGLCAGRLECRARPMRLAKMERHFRTPELLSAVDGDAVLCVAPPQEPGSGGLSGLRALILRKGQSVVLDAGTWHWIPYPTGTANVRFMVVFRAQTGDDDLDFFEPAVAADIAFQLRLFQKPEDF